MTYVICDPGSCHDGNYVNALELITIAKKCGADAIKFQLLTEEHCQAGNVQMPWEWMPDLMSMGATLGIKVFASVFCKAGIEYLDRIGCDTIKFAYSQHELVKESRDLLKNFNMVYVSTDLMRDNHRVGRDTVYLYCIPLYPVPYMINFDGLFGFYEGFSSHCMGIRQELRAVKAGANIIEKHFQGDWHSDCPDAKFALKPTELKQMVKEIRCCG